MEGKKNVIGNNSAVGSSFESQQDGHRRLRAVSQWMQCYVRRGHTLTRLNKLLFTPKAMSTNLTFDFDPYCQVIYTPTQRRPQPLSTPTPITFLGLALQVARTTHLESMKQQHSNIWIC